jgi:hypothetical protein
MDGKFFAHREGQLLIELEGVRTIIALPGQNKGMQAVCGLPMS